MLFFVMKSIKKMYLKYWKTTMVLWINLNKIKWCSWVQDNIRAPQHVILFFFSCTAACRILDPQPGIEPAPSAVKAQSANPWTTRRLLLLGAGACHLLNLSTPHCSPTCRAPQAAFPLFCILLQYRPLRVKPTSPRRYVRHYMVYPQNSPGALSLFLHLGPA